MKKLIIFFGILLMAASAFAAEKTEWPAIQQEQTWPDDQAAEEWPANQEQTEWPANLKQAEWPTDNPQTEWPANQEQADWPTDNTQTEWPANQEQADWPNDVYPDNKKEEIKPAEPINNFYFLDFKWVLTSASTNYAGKTAKYRSSDSKAALRISQNTEKPSCAGWTTCEEKQCKNSKQKYWFLTTAEKTENWINVNIDKKDGITHNTKKKTNPFDLYFQTPKGSIRFQKANSQSPVLEEKFYSQLLCQEGEELLPKIIATL